MLPSDYRISEEGKKVAHSGKIVSGNDAKFNNIGLNMLSLQYISLEKVYQSISVKKTKMITQISFDTTLFYVCNAMLENSTLTAFSEQISRLKSENPRERPVLSRHHFPCINKLFES